MVRDSKPLLFLHLPTGALLNLDVILWGSINILLESGKACYIHIRMLSPQQRKVYGELFKIVTVIVIVYNVAIVGDTFLLLLRPAPPWNKAYVVFCVITCTVHS